MTEFTRLELESQYEIYICGNQTREPPSIHLATPFAKRGSTIVGFLKSKLTAAGGDLTTRDIILVFSEMSRLKTYDVAADRDLMRVLAEATARVKDPDWRKMCEHSLHEIQRRAQREAAHS